MKYLFILGRNPKLSIMELKSYFEKEKNKILKENLKENGLLLELEKEIEKNLIDKLGGTISIGIVLSKINELDKINIYNGTKNKFNYCIWDYSEKKDEVSDILKKRFKSEKLKGVEKKLKNLIKLQNGEKAQNVSSKLINEEYFVYDNFFGKIIQKNNYEEIEKRDMKKPVRRESLSISPRLAKIMINLSKVKKNETLLDAFCGIGVILEEALNQEIKVIGIDKDKKAISGAKRNLNWFKFNKKNYDLINEDSSIVKIENVSVMCSEPDFGKTLKKIPTKEKAKKTIKNFENLMIKIINNVKNNINGNIVFTAPLIRIGKKRIGCNFEKISKQTFLNLKKDFPIPEFRHNQIVGRDIVVLEKN